MNQDFVDLLRAFVDHDVRFLIVGAYALGVHGRPRATGDLDVWVEPTPQNADRVMKALEAFGAPLGQVTAADFGKPGIVFQMGLPPVRIDVLTDLTGVTFSEAWPTRTVATLTGLTRSAYLTPTSFIPSSFARSRLATAAFSAVMSTP
jgi:hypothetical protein